MTGQTPQNQKKKLLYVITKGNWGGAQRYVYDLATSLSGEFDISVAIGTQGELNDKLLKKKIRVINIRGLGRDVKIIDDIKAFFTLLNVFIKEHPDVVHLNSSKIGAMGALAARIYNLLPKGNLLKAASYKLKARVVFTAHGWAFLEKRNTLSRSLIKFLQWLTVIFAHATIAVSKHTATEALKFPFAKHKIFMIHNGINTHHFKDKNTAREELLGKKITQYKDAICVGTIAELHKNKGIVYALKAIYEIGQKNPGVNIILIIVGGGEEQKRLERLTKDLEIQSKIFFIGHKNNAHTYLRAFDIFTLTSLKEGLPYVILEAGAAKLPVVATSIGGIPEIIKDMETGILVRPENVHELVKAYEFLVTNENKRKEFGIKLHEFTSEKFSLSSMVENTKIIYNIC